MPTNWAQQPIKLETMAHLSNSQIDCCSMTKSSGTLWLSSPGMQSELASHFHWWACRSRHPSGGKTIDCGFSGTTVILRQLCIPDGCV